MIEEKAVVAKIENNQIWVETESGKGCGGCSQSGACSTSVLDKFIKRKAYLVDCSIDLSPGDQVIVGIDESVLLKGSIILYLFPLLSLIAGAGVASMLFTDIGQWKDLWVAFSGMLCLGLSLIIINRFQNSFLFSFLARPVVLKKLNLIS